MRKSWVLLLVLWLFLGCFFADIVALDAEKPKNIVYIIVDGMGPASITGARLYKGGSTASLALERLPYSGFVKTYSLNNFVTDSAAAGTALATGVKTRNGMISTSPLKKKIDGVLQPLRTVLDDAKEVGKRVGIVSTARITHATPAAFYAHAGFRGQENYIARQLLDSDVDLVLGGGRRHFLPNTANDLENGEAGRRTDGRFLLDELAKQGATVVQRFSEFDALDETSVLPIVGLFNYGHMEYEIARSKDVWGEPSLAQMVDKSMSILSAQSPDGYFLVVEAARVDHAGHQHHDREYFIEMLAMDKMLETVFEKSGPDTLIVVTSDHETGGLSLNGYAHRLYMRGDSLFKGDASDRHMKWATQPSSKHTAVDVPVLAKGPGAQRFVGFMDNTDIPKRIRQIMGWFGDSAGGQ